MARPYSSDIRARVIGAVESGGSARAAARQYDVSASFVIALVRRWRDTGSYAAKRMGGYRRPRLAAHRDWLLALIAETPDLTLEEVRSRLRERDVSVSVGTVWRFFDRHGITFKKTAHAAEQERPDVRAAREIWRAAQPTLDPAKLVFLDETGAATNMARRRGRAPRGERLIAAIPHGHWKTTTFVAGLRRDRITAPLVIDGPMNGVIFRAYVEQFLAPSLQPGDIVIIDNLSAHKVVGVRKAIEARGARVCYLPPYSPDFNPIEQLFAKLKALLRKAAKRNVEELWNTIGQLLGQFLSVTQDMTGLCNR